MLVHWLKLRRTPGIRPVPEERPGSRPAPWRRDEAEAGPEPEIFAQLTEKFSDAVRPIRPVFRSDATVWVDASRIVEVCTWLRDEKEFNFPTDLCGIHTPDLEHVFEVVIHLFSTSHHERLRLKVALPPGASMPSLTGVWAGMNWHERETFDLVGVTFTGHPNLKRILLPDDFAGHPLQKDFPLKG